MGGLPQPGPSGPAMTFPPAASPRLWPAPTRPALSACSAAALTVGGPQDGRRADTFLTEMLESHIFVPLDSQGNQ